MVFYFSANMVAPNTGPGIADKQGGIGRMKMLYNAGFKIPPAGSGN